MLAAVVLGVGAGVIIARRSGDKPTDGPSVTSSAPTSSTPVNSPTPSPTPTPTPAPLEWQRGTDLPDSLEAAGVTVFSGAVWVVGGTAPSAGRPALDKVWFYENGWQPGPKLPVRLDSMPVASDGKRLFVVGGQTTDSEGKNRKISRDVWVLDGPDDDSWEVLNRLPEERSGGALAWDGQRLVFAGGLDRRDLNGDGKAENVNHADVWVWEGEDEWREIGQLQREREDLVAASDGNGRVWFLGGADVRKEDPRVPLGAVDLVERRSHHGAVRYRSGTKQHSSVASRSWRMPVRRSDTHRDEEFPNEQGGLRARDREPVSDGAATAAADPSEGRRGWCCGAGRDYMAGWRVRTGARGTSRSSPGSQSLRS